MLRIILLTAFLMLTVMKTIYNAKQHRDVHCMFVMSDALLSPFNN